MKKSIAVLVCAASLVALASLAAPFAERDVVRADGAWTMGREDALSISGRVVSSVDFDDAKWLPAKVPGTVLDNMVRNGLLPDPYFGTNNRRKLKAIPDLNDVDREYYSAWFRTEVEVPASFKGRKVWLRPEGINYRGEIWLNGTLVGETAGMFRRPVFDVTDVARPGGRNILAVKVRPVDFPGDPRPKTWGAAGEWRNGGNGDIGKNVTMLMSIGWDFTFSDGIRDRNTGIWKDVTLFATGPIRLDAPVVRTRFAGGSLDRAEIEAEVTVDNYLGRRTAGEVVEFEVEGTGVKQRARVDVRRGECAAVTFKAALDGPKLWWPRNKGGQNLYTAVFTAYSGEKDRENEVVDRVKVPALRRARGVQRPVGEGRRAPVLDQQAAHLHPRDELDSGGDAEDRRRADGGGGAPARGVGREPRPSLGRRHSRKRQVLRALRRIRTYGVAGVLDDRRHGASAGPRAVSRMRRGPA